MSNKQDIKFALSALDAEREDLQRRLKELEEEAQRLQREPDPKIAALAERLHKELCAWNHTDGCSWFYEIKDSEHQWDQWAHKKWLDKAAELFGCIDELLLQGSISEDTVIEFLFKARKITK